jgi:hypothetical protein
VDGLAAQISDPDAAIGPAMDMQNRWHDTFAHPMGILYRESLDGLDGDKSIADFKKLLDDEDYLPGENYHAGTRYHSGNKVFDRMAEALAETIIRAVHTITNDPDRYARMVWGALEQQERTGDWDRHWEIMKRVIGP